jgi:cysteine desulfurase
MEDLGIDFIVFSGHKMYAPFGGGAIVGNRNIFDAFWPYQMGGGNFPYISKNGQVFRNKNEQAHDPGTPNFIGIRSIHHSIKQIERIGIKNIKTHENKLINKVYNELKKIKDVTIYNPSNTEGLETSVIVFNLKGFSCYLLSEILNDEYGIGTRSGSFCVYEFTRRIMKIEIDENIVEKVKKGDTSLIPGCVRISFGLINTIDDVETVVKAIKDISIKGIKNFESKYSQVKNKPDYRKI